MNNKSLINDNRLTPTMERIREGRTQLFRERNKNDRSFISKENADVILVHDNKAMYAELIEGEWYWVNGCAECNGKERTWVTYIECEEHDRCSRCSISRKDITGSVYGARKGWICNSCNEAQKLESRKNAFDKLNGEEPDCSYTDEIICPHCGSTIDNADKYEDQDLDCSICEGEIHLEVIPSFTYTTTIKGKRVTE